MKGKKTDLGRSGCAASRALHVVGDWWSLLIIRDALVGLERFSEFQSSIGLARNILATRLKKLVSHQIMVVQADPVRPSVNRYLLTRRGRELAVVLVALWQWGEDNCFDPEELASDVVDGVNRAIVSKVVLRTESGETIDLDRFQMRLRPRSPSKSTIDARVDG